MAIKAFDLFYKAFVFLVIEQGYSRIEAARSLKQERVQWRSYQTRWEAQQDIVQYIAVFYNGYRLHSKLDYVSPNEYEKQFNEIRKVA